MELEDRQHTILSIGYCNGRVGVCFYFNESQSICLGEYWETIVPDLTNPTQYSFSTLKILLMSYFPCEILVSSKCDDKLYYFLDQYRNSAKKSSVCLQCHSCNLKKLPFSFFSFEEACILLQSIFSVEDTKNNSQDFHISKKFACLQSRINFDNVIMVRVTGAILTYVLNVNLIHDPVSIKKVAQRTASGTRLVNDMINNTVNLLDIRNIKNLELDDTLQFDQDVLDYLQILHFDDHPSLYGIGEVKEGLSLLSILNRCKSVLGKIKIKQWILRPLRSCTSITKRLDSVQALMENFSESVMQQFWQHLRHIHDLPKICNRLQVYGGTVGDWTRLRDSLVHLIQLNLMIKSEYNAAGYCVNVLGDIMGFGSWAVIEELTQVLSKTIDYESSQFEDRIVIRKGVDEEIDRGKSILDSLDVFLDSVAKEEIKKFSHFPSLRVLYIPQMGFLVAIPTSEELDYTRMVEMNGPSSEMEFQFASSTYIYWKTQTTRELDEFLGDIRSNIVDAENAICRKIAEKVVFNKAHFVQLCEYISDLDCLLSFASVSRENLYCRPVILDPRSNTPQLLVRKGRNPILELAIIEKSSLIPNDIEMKYDGDSGLVQLLVGPNNSGKSVYLKQCGMICYMAQLGCYTPAESVVLTPIDRIFVLPSVVRVSKVDGMSLSLSKSKEVKLATKIGNGRGHFFSSLVSVSSMLKLVTADSLVLLDEFGKQTTETDASALLQAIINYLTGSTGGSATSITDSMAEEVVRMFPRSMIVTHLNIVNSPMVNRVKGVFQVLHTRVLLSSAAMAVRPPRPTSRKSKKSKTVLITDCMEFANKKRKELIYEGTSDVDAGWDGFANPVFLYKIDVGCPKDSDEGSLSLGIYCAQLSGLRKSIVDRSRVIWDRMSRFEKVNALAVGKKGATFDEIVNDGAMDDLTHDQNVDEMIRKLVDFYETIRRQGNHREQSDKSASKFLSNVF